MVVIGDIHANFDVLRHIEADVIYQVGDFGVWPGLKEWDNFKGTSTPLYFCPGNHENWDYLEQFTTITELKPNVFYVPPWTIHNDILFIGGANSIDRQWRTPGFSWFPQEIIGTVPLTLPSSVKYIISHTCPESIFPLLSMPTTDNDPTRKALEQVKNKIALKHWFFGHFHISMSHDKFTCLNIGECYNDST